MRGVHRKMAMPVATANDHPLVPDALVRIVRQLDPLALALVDEAGDFVALVDLTPTGRSHADWACPKAR